MFLRIFWSKLSQKPYKVWPQDYESVILIRPRSRWRATRDGESLFWTFTNTQQQRPLSGPIQRKTGQMKSTASSKTLVSIFRIAGCHIWE
jgi:hypothetical protein